MIILEEAQDFFGEIVSQVRFWASGSKKKPIQVLQLTLLLVAIPVATLLLNQRLQFFGKAAEFTARVDLPANITAKVGQEFTAVMTLGSGDVSIEKVNVVLRIRDFDARKFSSPQASSRGVINIELLQNGFKGSKILTSIKFKALAPGKYYVDFDPTSSTVTMASNPPKNIVTKFTNMMVTVDTLY